MAEQGPFLLILDVKDAKGDPIPNAVLDGWQADSEGVYHFASWTLRGKVTADAYGRAEILTVRPGDYGAPLLGKRAGHLHLMVTGVQGKHAPLTTQVYVCPANDTEHLRIDLYVLRTHSPKRPIADAKRALQCGHVASDSAPEYGDRVVDTCCKRWRTPSQLA